MFYCRGSGVARTERTVARGVFDVPVDFVSVERSNTGSVVDDINCISPMGIGILLHTLMSLEKRRLCRQHCGNSCNGPFYFREAVIKNGAELRSFPWENAYWYVAYQFLDVLCFLGESPMQMRNGIRNFRCFLCPPDLFAFVRSLLR